MSKLLRIIESLILAIFFGFVPVLFCLFATLVIASVLFGEKVIGPWVLWSLVPAVVIDVILLRKWIRRAYQTSNNVLGVIYLFYSLVALGMFMGVPIGCLFLGIAAGIYSARRMQLTQADEGTRKQYFKKTAAFCAAVMALMCCLIALWAIAGQMIGYRLETPFLSFTFTVPIFFAVALTGGVVLVLLQYFLTLVTAIAAFRLLAVARES